MLLSHINAIEQVLLSQSHAAKNAGHPNLRGGPREWFIRDFLTGHLPSTLEIGQGEIIDSSSPPNPPKGSYRPQVDVVIYRRDMPKISYSQFDSAYLAEGVMATIESKSQLTQTEFVTACDAARTHKSLNRGVPEMTIGNAPDKIISYIIAYSGPANMKTVSDWLVSYVQSNNVQPKELVDLVVVLGVGVLWRLDSFAALSIPSATPNHNWAYINQADKNLFTLFTHMLGWVSTTSSTPNTLGYASKVRYQNIGLV